MRITPLKKINLPLDLSAEVLKNKIQNELDKVLEINQEENQNIVFSGNFDADSFSMSKKVDSGKFLTPIVNGSITALNDEKSILDIEIAYPKNTNTILKVFFCLMCLVIVFCLVYTIVFKFNFGLLFTSLIMIVLFFFTRQTFDGELENIEKFFRKCGIEF